MKSVKTIAVALTLPLSVAALPALAQVSPGWGGGYGACPGIGFGLMGGGWIMMVMMLIWVVLIVLVVYGVINWIRRMGPPGSSSPDKPPVEKAALQILEEAYARSEISREEFLQKREDIVGKAGAH